MTETVNLTEHGDPSEPLQLDQIDVDWIEQENEKEEKRHNRGLKKLELINSKGRFKLKAKGHVGSISLPSRKFIINIKPKFENAWDNLFKLFDYAEGIDASYGTSQVYADPGDTLWDIIAKIFGAHAMHLIKKGLYRTYITKTEEITAIRGRLLLVQNIRSPQKFRIKHWCEFDEFSHDVPENQCVLYCTSMLLRYVKNTTIKQELVRIRNIILSQDVTLKHRFTLFDANLITINRMNKDYEKIFVYCKLILQSLAYKKFSDAKGILIPDFTISMWDLFEKFVNKVLVEHYKPKKIDVDFQDPTKPIVKRIPDYPDIHKTPGPSPMEPDNIISSKDGKLILDTKWKKKVPSNDWYQAIAYSLALKCDTILLLPKVDEKYSDGFRIPEEYCRDCDDIKIHIKTIDFEQASKSGDFIKDLISQIEDIVDKIELKSSITQ